MTEGPPNAQAGLWTQQNVTSIIRVNSFSAVCLTGDNGGSGATINDTDGTFLAVQFLSP